MVFPYKPHCIRAGMFNMVQYDRFFREKIFDKTDQNSRKKYTQASFLDKFYLLVCQYSKNKIWQIQFFLKSLHDIQKQAAWTELQCFASWKFILTNVLAQKLASRQAFQQ